jgi:uncharacterized PurR-regulated membrane protein YhhQ (DUF165 family)
MILSMERVREKQHSKQKSKELFACFQESYVRIRLASLLRSQVVVVQTADVTTLNSCLPFHISVVYFTALAKGNMNDEL